MTRINSNVDGYAVYTRKEFGNVASTPVFELQKALNEVAGSKWLPETGILDPKTERALRDLQQAHGLPVTGHLDVRSSEILNRMILEKRSKAGASSSQKAPNGSRAKNSRRAEHSVGETAVRSKLDGLTFVQEKGLREGESGKAVEDAQRDLNLWLRMRKRPEVPVSGVYDRKTEAALKEFHKANKLEYEKGFVGEDTLVHMKLEGNMAFHLLPEATKKTVRGLMKPTDFSRLREPVRTRMENEQKQIRSHIAEIAGDLDFARLSEAQQHDVLAGIRDGGWDPRFAQGVKDLLRLPPFHNLNDRTRSAMISLLKGINADARLPHHLNLLVQAGLGNVPVTRQLEILNSLSAMASSDRPKFIENLDLQ